MKRGNLWNGKGTLVTWARLQKQQLYMPQGVCSRDVEAHSSHLPSWESLPGERQVTNSLQGAAPVGATIAFDLSHILPGQHQSMTEHGGDARDYFHPRKHSFLGTLPSACPFIDAKFTSQSEGSPCLLLLPHPWSLIGTTPNRSLAPLILSWHLLPKDLADQLKRIIHFVDALFHKWYKVA